MVADLVRRFWARLYPDPLPVLKAMPPHVDAVKLDMGLLFLAMENGHQANPAVKTGINLPRKDD